MLSAPVVLNVVVNDGVAPRIGLGLELVVGAVAWVLVYLRRRQPFLVALVCALCAVVSTLALGPAVLALVSLATWRRAAPLLVVAATAVVGSTVWGHSMRGAGDQSWWVSLLLTTIALAVAAGWGLYLGSRRVLIATLRQRAQRAEAEQHLREEQARSRERAQIAREMHDVVGHRISQVSMRAGALAFREDLSVAELRENSAVIQQTANEALRELRGVLGVLREVGAPADGDAPVAVSPPPAYADIADLVERTRSAGTVVELDREVDVAVPEDLGRALYRVVQEGLTNATKHAPAVPVQIRIRTEEDGALHLLMANAWVGGGPTSIPGAGLGVVGMAERVQLLGGRLEHGADDEGFRLLAWIPLPS